MSGQRPLLLGGFDAGDLVLDLLNAVDVELWLAVEGVDAVLLRIHVGQLCVAVAEHVLIVEEQRAHQIEAPV